MLPIILHFFLELLRSPHALFTQLRRMKRYGILGRYLPEFGKVIGKMQYDLFHIYTVDAHTLLVIKNLRRLRYSGSHKNFPLVTQVFQHLPKVELAYIAGLYHDIAKGRGGDHSKLGSVDAYKFCQRHQLNEWDCKLVSWLVENHLLMSMTAQRQDISDPEVIHAFAKKTGNATYLDYLYVLTVADICATNPTLWNSWRASLLKQLYLETRNALRRGLENPIDKKTRVENTQYTALQQLSQTFSEIQIKSLWEKFGDEYFLQNSAEDIIWHTQEILNHTGNTILVATKSINKEGQTGATQIFVYIEDQDNLFAATVAVLDQLHLNILDANITTTSDNFSLDTYIILTEQGAPLSDDAKIINNVTNKIQQALKNPSEYKEAIQRYIPRRLKNFTIPTEVDIYSDNSTQKTVLEIITRDQPGLLAHLGQIFSTFNIYIHKAKITTLGERVEDVFFITNQNKKPISDPVTCDQLISAICNQLDHQQQQENPNQ